jgi:hypothetical protein
MAIEQHLLDQSLAQNHGCSTLILWNTAEIIHHGRQRTILASCQIRRLNGIVSHLERGRRRVEEVTCYVVENVYCRPDFGNRGYARRMMKELGEGFAKENAELGLDKCTFATPLSAVRTSLYAPVGFREFLSFDLSLKYFTEDISKVESIRTGFHTSPIYGNMLPYVCAIDTNVLRTSQKTLRKARKLTLLYFWNEI